MEMNNHEIQDFEKDVIEESFNRPIVIDFWAEWCAPCRMLGPVLEKLEAQSDGAWKLVKINTDVNPEFAQAFSIRSIPLVKMFKDGKEVDEFVGALPEQKIVEWLKKHITVTKTSGFDAVLQLIEQGRAEDAVPLLAEMLGGEFDKRARVHLARILVFSDTKKALELIADMDAEKQDWDLAEALKTIAGVLLDAQNGTEFPEAPVKGQFLAAVNLLSAQEFSAALEQLIEVIREDRYYMDDAARKICIAVFKFLGEENPITIKSRRPFGSALYV